MMYATFVMMYMLITMRKEMYTERGGSLKHWKVVKIKKNQFSLGRDMNERASGQRSKVA